MMNEFWVSTVCRQYFLGTSFEFADLSPLCSRICKPCFAASRLECPTGKEKTTWTTFLSRHSRAFTKGGISELVNFKSKARCGLLGCF